MNGSEISELVDQRLTVVENLIELTTRQAEAIQRGHMSDLMSVLAAKQSPVQELANLSKRLGRAVADDPENREWASPSARQTCRERHDRCEAMILSLLDAEKECESALSGQHVRLQAELDQAQGTGRAIDSYNSVSAGYQSSQVPAGGTAIGSGDRLDLSSQ